MNKRKKNKSALNLQIKGKQLINWLIVAKKTKTKTYCAFYKKKP